MTKAVQLRSVRLENVMEKGISQHSGPEVDISPFSSVFVIIFKEGGPGIHQTCLVFGSSSRIYDLPAFDLFSTQIPIASALSLESGCRKSYDSFVFMLLQIGNTQYLAFANGRPGELLRLEAVAHCHLPAVGAVFESTKTKRLHFGDRSSVFAGHRKRVLSAKTA